MTMEMGKTVVLLNLDNLYESLYDALNQVHTPIHPISGTHIIIWICYF